MPGLFCHPERSDPERSAKRVAEGERSRRTGWQAERYRGPSTTGLRPYAQGDKHGCVILSVVSAAIGGERSLSRSRRFRGPSTTALRAYAQGDRLEAMRIDRITKRFVSHEFVILKGKELEIRIAKR
jgi:hypothetical protein